MSRVKCYMVEPTGIGRVFKGGNPGVVVGECTRENFGVKFIGSIWTPIYVNVLTRERKVWEEFEPGAMVLHEWGLTVKLPNGNSWNIDGRANNCTKPQDSNHRCWCRHGTPPEITVDKVGLTCGAGSGSIKSGDYHGFLRGGYLESC